MGWMLAACVGLSGLVGAAGGAGAQDSSSTAPAQEASPAEDGAETWCQWRGPRRDGSRPGRAWPEQLRLEPSWQIEDLGPSYCGPIVTEDRVFSVETRDERDEVVRAFDRATGEEQWRIGWTGSMTVPFFAAKNGSWVRSTPAYADGRLYVGGIQDVLFCLDGDGGDIVWSADFKQRHGTPDPSFGMVCSPLIDGDALYVQAAGSVLRLDRETGETRWRAMKDAGGMDSAFSSPVVAELSGRRQLVVQTRSTLAGLDLESGAVLWQRPIRAFRGMNILTPTVFEDAVFTATYGGRAQLLDITQSEGQATAEPRWDVGVQGYMTSPVAVDGHVYFFTRSNRFTCLDLESGEEAWTSGPTGDEYWSLVHQGDRILALNDSGTLRMIAADPAEYRVLAEAEVGEASTWAHLAVAGRELFVRELDGLRRWLWVDGEATR